jgi:chromosome partitioning protein
MDHYVVSVGGQKGGTGKSTVAQGIAVEAARTGGIVMLADLDLKQATSAEWAKRRKAAGHKPAIEARLISQRQVWELQALCNLLVIDAPGYADNSTLELAQRSDLLVLTTGTNLIELEPTVLLTRELMTKGIPQEKVAIALVKVIDREREKEARAYLKDAKLTALEPALGWYKAIHDIGTDGRAVTESPNRAVAAHGAAFFGGIAGALERLTQPEKHKRRSVAVAEATRERGGRERG